jgi:hypothetical protein
MTYIDSILIDIGMVFGKVLTTNFYMSMLAKNYNDS